jgi:hypothetical protein
MFNCFNLAYQHAIESVAKLSGKKVEKRNIKKEGKETIGKSLIKLQACNLRLLLPVDAIAAFTRDLCPDTDFMIHKKRPLNKIVLRKRFLIIVVINV